jgi:NAD(P)H dehydrogenase (quinone)
MAYPPGVARLDCDMVRGELMPTYAVTGASGHFGRRVVEELVDRGVRGTDIVAIARTTGKAADLAARGAQLRPGDYSRPETLPAALMGVERLLLISGSELGQRVPQHTAVIDAAKNAGVERILYTSMVKADTSTNPIAGEHRGTETALRMSVSRNWRDSRCCRQRHGFCCSPLRFRPCGRGGPACRR